jgi:hypothetical protein
LGEKNDRRRGEARRFTHLLKCSFLAWGASGRGEVRPPPDLAKCDSEQARAKQDKTDNCHSEENEFFAHGTAFALFSAAH